MYAHIHVSAHLYQLMYAHIHVSAHMYRLMYAHIHAVVLHAVMQQAVAVTAHSNAADGGGHCAQ